MIEQKCVRTYDKNEYCDNRYYKNETRVCCEELTSYLEKGWLVVFITPKADYTEYIIEREVDDSRKEIEKRNGKLRKELLNVSIVVL